MPVRATSYLAAGAVACAAVLVPSPALAASTITKTGGGYTLTMSSPGSVTVTQVGPLGLMRFQSSEGIASAPVPYCSGGAGDWTCEGVTSLVVHGTAGADIITTDVLVPVTVEAGAGDDVVTTSGTGAIRVVGGLGNDVIHNHSSGASGLDGGDGDDRVHGGTGPDSVKGGSGNDELSGGLGKDNISGGPGNDVLIGDSANRVATTLDDDDSLMGEDGDDVLMGLGGADNLRGGPGNDTAGYVGQYAAPVAFSFSTTGQHDDGAAGERDTADSQVENLVVTGSLLASATIEMNDAANTVTVDAAGPISIKTHGGDDDVTANGTAATVDAGEGDDRIRTGPGDDVIVNGAGTDTIDTGAGDDTIDAVDRTQDTITCGAGTDRARVDGDRDTVSVGRATACEALDLVRATPPVKLPKKARVSAKGIVKLKVASRLVGPVKVKVLVKAPFGRVAQKKASIRTRGKGTLALRLSKPAVNRLRRGPLTVKVTVMIVDGGSGKRARKIRLFR